MADEQKRAHEEGKLIEVNEEQLHLNPITRRVAPQAVQQLAADIRVHGQETHVHVRQNNDGSYRVIDGNHRLVAIRSLMSAGEWHDGGIQCLQLPSTQDDNTNDLLDARRLNANT